MNTADILTRPATMEPTCWNGQPRFVSSQATHSTSLVKDLLAKRSAMTIEHRDKGFEYVDVVSLPKNVELNRFGQHLLPHLRGAVCDIACSCSSAVRSLCRSVGSRRWMGIDLQVFPERETDAESGVEEILLQGDALDILSQVAPDSLDVVVLSGLEAAETGEVFMRQTPEVARQSYRLRALYLGALVKEMSTVLRPNGMVLLASNGDDDHHLLHGAAVRSGTLLEIPLFPERAPTREKLMEARNHTLQETFTTEHWTQYAQRNNGQWVPPSLRPIWVYGKKVLADSL